MPRLMAESALNGASRHASQSGRWARPFAIEAQQRSTGCDCVWSACRAPRTHGEQLSGIPDTSSETTYAAAMRVDLHQREPGNHERHTIHTRREGSVDTHQNTGVQRGYGENACAVHLRMHRR